MKAKILKILFVVLVFSFIFFALLKNDDFEKLEILSQDYKQSLALKFWQQRTKQSSIRNNIVILAVDDLTAFDLANHYPAGTVKWPLSRKNWANVIDFVEQGRPKVLTLCFAFYNYEDITFSPTSADSIFASALKKYNNIVLGTALSTSIPVNQNALMQTDLQQIKPMSKSLNLDISKDLDVVLPTYYSFLPVPNIFVNNSQIGYVNLTKDNDGVVRRSTPISKLVVSNQSYNMPSLAFATFVKYANAEDNFVIKDMLLKAEKYTIPLDHSGSNTINWNGLSRTYQMIPFSKIVIAAESGANNFEYDKKTYPVKYFKDKIVIIAPTQSNMDTFKTPVDKELSIAEINANIIENYINDSNSENLSKRKFLRQVPYYISILLGLSFALFIVFNALLFRLSWLSFLSLIFIFSLYCAFNVISYVHPKIRLDFLSVYPLYFMVVSSILSYIYVLYDEKSRKKSIKTVFEKRVSSEVIKRLCNDGFNLDSIPTTSTVAILCCNFSNFSNLLKKVDDKEAVNYLNKVLKVFTQNIYKYNGTIDRISGDKIFAYWGFPLEVINPSLSAVKAAVEIIKETDKLNSELEIDEFKFEFRFAINTGETLIARIGNEDWKDISILGDTVNFVSKIDEISTQFNKKLLISEHTYKDVTDFIQADYAGTLKLKGKDIQLGLYVPRLGKDDDKS